MRKCSSVFSRLTKKYSYIEFVEFLDSLRIQGKWYSMFNAALISIQKPGAGLIFTETVWNKHGMLVKENATPIVIMQPFGPVNFVYEQSDVMSDGSEQGENYIKKIQAEIIEENTKKNKITEDDYIMLKLIANKFGAKVEEKSEFGQNLKGKIYVEAANHTIKYYKETIRTPFVIQINSKLGPEEKTKTLLHELGHFLCAHHTDAVKGRELDKKIMLVERCDELYSLDNIKRRDVQEYEAETVCKMVCDKYNFFFLDDYLCKYQKNLGEISMDYILNATDMITKEWDKMLS